MGRNRDEIVYSTDPAPARRCARCGSSPCRCNTGKSPPPQQQTVRIRREKKGRGGKTVTVVSDLRLTPEGLAALGKRLRELCASGGTVKDGNIEIQGDHREKIAAELRKLGYKVKLAGG